MSTFFPKSSSPHFNASFNSKILFNLLLFFGVGVLIVARAPVLFTEPRFWAEEGSVFWAHTQQSDFWGSLFFSPRNTAGYFLLSASLPCALAAEFFSIEQAPAVTTYFSLAVLLTLFAIVLWGKSLVWQKPWQSAVACAIFLFNPAMTGEVWLNAINAQVYCGMIGLCLLLEDLQGISGIRRWCYRMILLFCSFSGVYTLFLGLGFFWRWRRVRSRENGIHLAIVFFAGLIQVALFLFLLTGQLVSATKLSRVNWERSAVNVLSHQVVTPVLGDDLGRQVLASAGLYRARNLQDGEQPQYARLAGLAALVLLLGLFYFLGRHASDLSLVLMLIAFLSLAFLTSVFAMNGIARGRYAVLPGSVLVLFLFTAALRAGSDKILKNTCAVLLWVSLATGLWEFRTQGADSYFGTRADRPNWAAEIAQWRADPYYLPKIWPYPRWRVALATGDQIEDLRRGLSNIQPFGLSSSGEWHSNTLNLPPLPQAFGCQIRITALKAIKKCVFEVALYAHTDPDRVWRREFPQPFIHNGQQLDLYIDHRFFGTEREGLTQGINRIEIRLKAGPGRNAAMRIEKLYYVNPFAAF